MSRGQVIDGTKIVPEWAAYAAKVKAERAEQELVDNYREQIYTEMAEVLRLLCDVLSKGELVSDELQARALRVLAVKEKLGL